MHVIKMTLIANKYQKLEVLIIVLERMVQLKYYENEVVPFVGNHGVWCLSKLMK